MDNKLPNNYLILMIIPIFFSCSGSVKKENKTTATASLLALHVGNEKYFKIDTKESVVVWKGASLMGSNSHTGYIYISKGELRIENNQLMGGVVEVDMNTIEDKNHAKNNNLVNHLKNLDFFEVEKFPFSTIEINKVSPANGEHKQIIANLTIKGITHTVSFPAKTEIKDGIARANGKLVIDRAKWNVRYKSAKFYDLVSNQVISDSIEFEMKIVAKK